MKNRIWSRKFGAASAGMVAVALVCASIVTGTASSSAISAHDASTPIVLTSPTIPGVAPLPGPIAAPATPASNIGILSISPNEGVVGSMTTVSGKGLPASASIQLNWTTENATWVVGAAPDTVNYLGAKYTAVTVVLDTVKTDATGAFTTQIQIPKDFGGNHEIYAVVGSSELAEGGFVTTRTATMTPTSGPVGTPITITYTGIGASQYTGGGSLLYDNHYVGELMANWTRGVATLHIRASGVVGNHVIQIGNAISYLYLNVPQSPIPYTNGMTMTFKVTKQDKTPPAASIDWPVDVSPTLSQITTLDEGGLGVNSNVSASLSTTKGPVDSSVMLSATGLPSDGPVSMQWASVVGNRVNCASTCWSFVTQPMSSATVSGNSIDTPVTIPDGLGGWHAIQVVQNGTVVAQVPFYVMASIVGAGVSSLTVKEGQPFTIHIKGIGWTQLDNTVGVDYDNSYMGYGCGFNSNGDVLLNLVATGGVGTHLIDLYPMLYSLSPSFANTPYGMVPMLTYAQDNPGLALGYHLPAMRFAINVVK